MKLIETGLSMTTHKGGNLDIHLICKFSRCVWLCVLAYYYLEHDCDNKEVDKFNKGKIRKEFKTHQTAINFDERFITHTCIKGMQHIK